MPPDLLLYPVFDHREASMRITDPEVVHPTTKDRVDHLNHLPRGLTDVLSEDLSKLCKQLRPLLQLRRIVRSPHPLTAAHTTIFKAQKRETPILRQIDHPALFLIDLDSEFCQLLPQSLFYRLHQPFRSRKRVN